MEEREAARKAAQEEAARLAAEEEAARIAAEEANAYLARLAEQREARRIASLSKAKAKEEVPPPNLSSTTASSSSSLSMEEQLRREIEEAEEERKRLEAKLAAHKESTNGDVDEEINNTSVLSDHDSWADKIIESSESSSLKMEEQIKLEIEKKDSNKLENLVSKDELEEFESSLDSGDEVDKMLSRRSMEKHAAE